MLEKYFNAFIVTSVVSSIFFLLLLLIKPFTKKYFSSLWHYYIFFTVVLVFLLPIRINFPSNEINREITTLTRFIPYNNINYGGIENIIVKENVKISLANIWFYVCLTLVFTKIIRYIICIVKLKNSSKNISCGKIKTRTCKNISSPFVIGLFFPVIYLPKLDITDEEKENILYHEMIHLKRCDILIKWTIFFAKCIHWFNPLIYFLEKEINLWCEISCDISATKNMDDTKKKSYISTILKLIENSSGNKLLTTSMASGKKILGKRFHFIKSYKKRKNILLSLVFYIVLMSLFFLLSGIANGVVNKKDAPVKILENPKINITKTQKQTDVPALEINVEKESFNVENIETKDEQAEPNKTEEITEENINIPNEDQTYYAGDVIIEEFSESMSTKKVIANENSNSILFKSPSSLVNLKTSHTWFDYSFDEKFVFTVSVIPDENGVISLFFDTEFSGATCDIYINHIDRPNMGWGYRFPTDNKKLYRFAGFDKNQKYQITLSSYFPGYYNIKGKALII